MPNDYYLCKDGKQTGPFSIDYLRSTWQQGGIDVETLYWVEGMPEWKAISELIPVLGPRLPAVSSEASLPPVKAILMPVIAPAIARSLVVPGPSNSYQLSIDDKGGINFSSDTLGGAKQGLEELKLSKKSYQLKKKELQIKAREIRQGYTDYTRTRLPMIRGGKTIGTVVRAFQSASRGSHRYELAKALQPIEEEINRIDKTLLNLEGVITQVAFKIQNFQLPASPSAS